MKFRNLAIITAGLLIAIQFIPAVFAAAADEYRKKAEQGDKLAQYNLGLCYERGWGAAKNPAEAAKWYRSAAEQGLAQAQYNLGCCYAIGLGVTKNLT